MMRRREFITLCAASWPLAAGGAWAQQPAKVWRIGMLETISSAQNAPQLDAFRQRLQQLGYVEGINFVIEYRSAEGRGDRFPSLVAELIQRNVDLLVLRGTPAAIAVKNATSTIPVVMTAVGDPLLVVASLSRPGGNLTGLSSFVVDLEAKRLELLKEIYPQAARVAALRNMGNPAVQNNWKEVEIAAQLLGVRAQLFDVRKSEDISLAFENAIKNQCNALLADQDALTQANKELIVSLAAKHRLPAIYPARDYAAAGGLMSFGVDYPDLYRRAAIYVDKIIKGAKPADLPVEQPTKFELVINQKTAKALGIPVPAIMLARADEVIE
jgi:putative tryptophan/tyrosine transport system substrate-binding protein